VKVIRHDDKRERIGMFPFCHHALNYNAASVEIREYWLSKVSD
jgi:hypothetical protein